MISYDIHVGSGIPGREVTCVLESLLVRASVVLTEWSGTSFRYVSGIFAVTDSVVGGIVVRRFGM